MSNIKKPRVPKAVNKLNPKAVAPVDMQAKDEDLGLVCRGCGCRHFETTHTRPFSKNRIRRRRICRHCGRIVTTYETVEDGQHGYR